MFDPSIILKALPNIWRNKFEDKDLLETLYGFIGTYISDCYRGALEELASQSLEYTPLTRNKTWKSIELNSVSRLYVGAEGELSSSYVVYGLLELDEILDSCSRIYRAPSLGGTYLESTEDYIFANSNSAIIKSIESRTNQANFFQRFDRFIIFLGRDPLLGFGDVETNDISIYYPLVIKIDKDSLTAQEQQDLVPGKSITITHLGITFSATLDSVEEIDNGTSYGAFLNTDSYGNINTNDVLKIEGLSSTPLSCSVIGGYLLPRELLKVWAFDCEVDQFQLQYKFQHLLGSFGGFQKSTIQYKNILRLVLEARLRTVSTDLLRKLGDVLAGSETLEYRDEYDTLLTLNLVTNRLTTAVTEYNLIPKSPINYRVINNIDTLVTDFGPISSDKLVEVIIGEGYIFDLIAQGLQESKIMSFVSFRDGFNGSVICSTDRFSLIIYSETTDITQPDSVKIIYGNQDHEYINLDPSSLTISRLDRTLPAGIGEPINPSVYISDVNTGGNWWQDVGLTIPTSVWDTDDPFRREISSDLWDLVIGSMDSHRVGDYLLTVGEGPVHETSYLLFRDFLLNKVALINTLTYANSSSSFRNIDQLRNITYKLINLSKLLIAIYKLNFVDFIPAASDNDLSVEIGFSLEETEIPSVEYGGVESVNPTLILELDSTITVGNNTTISIDSGADIDVVIRGYSDPYILVELSNPETLSVSLGAGDLPVSATITTEVNNQVSGQVIYTTNYIGSSSVLMCVGNTYPDYTKYYEFDEAYTINSSLELEIIP